MATILIALYVLLGFGAVAHYCYDNRDESFIEVSMLVAVCCFWPLYFFILLAHSFANAPSVRNPFWKAGTP